MSSGDDPIPLAIMRSEPAAYLVDIPARIFNPSMEDLVKANLKRLWTAELEAYCRAKSAWPKGRSFKKFLEWFDVEFASMIHDVGRVDIYKDLV